ncbi:MAG: thermonuclease family protein [Gammaproteobacteria bacterium]
MNSAKTPDKKPPAIRPRALHAPAPGAKHIRHRALTLAALLGAISGTIPGLGAGIPAAHAVDANADPATEYGRVVAVHDGNSFRMARDGGGELRVKLACTIAPESGEPGAEYARAALSSEVLGNPVSVRILGWERGHAIGHVYHEGARVGEALLRKGAAVRAAGG